MSLQDADGETGTQECLGLCRDSRARYKQPSYLCAVALVVTAAEIFRRERVRKSHPPPDGGEGGNPEDASARSAGKISACLRHRGRG